MEDKIEVYPRGVESRVRGLQVHGHAVEAASAGQRTALNLQGVERAAIERGDVVAPAGALLPALLADATLELLADAPRALKVRDRVRFHVGTQEVMARVLLVDRAELEPGQVSYGRFRLEAPIVALPGDRYVIRSYSPSSRSGAARCSTSRRRASSERARRCSRTCSFSTRALPPRFWRSTSARPARRGRGRPIFGRGRPSARTSSASFSRRG